MKTILFSILLAMTITSCVKEKVTTENKELTVQFIDFEKSCNENLEILNGITVSDFQKTYESIYLHADVDNFSIFQDLNFGDQLTIEYQILEENPYSQRLILCNRHGGVPIKILKIK